MPVVLLKRGRDQWLLQIPDDIDDASAQAKALRVANGYGENSELVSPGNGKAGWTVDSVHADSEFESLRQQVET